MNRGWIALLGGVLAGALMIGGVLGWRGGDAVQQSGQVLKLRSAAPDEQHSLIVLDLRLTNNSNVATEVRDVTLFLEAADGTKWDGRTISGTDTGSLFTYYPSLGEAYNKPLIANTRIDPHATADFMLAARFDIPEAVLAARRKLQVTVTDRTGNTTELLEKRK